MKLATVEVAGATHACRVEDDEVVLIEGCPDLGALLSDADWRHTASAASGHRLPTAEISYAPAIPAPNKIICLGLNYLSHITEMGRDRPAYPTLFAKFSGALIGANDPIRLPRVSDQVDWEAELAVIMGRAGRSIDRADALDWVAGYTVANDITMRDWQHRTREFLSGKTFERSTPLGPSMVTADELPGGATGLEVRCEVDGVVVQEGTTADLCFDVAQIVSYVSEIITLLPGDVILTGTPGGVGAGRQPPVYLRPGQLVRTSIERIGVLENTCEGEP